MSPFLQRQIFVNAICGVSREIQNGFCIIPVGTISLDVSYTKVNLCSTQLGSSTLYLHTSLSLALSSPLECP